MKRLVTILLACLLLCGCQTAKTERSKTRTEIPTDTQTETQTDTQPTQLPQGENSLLGTWVNGGTYENGSDYRETMTVLDDGTVVIIMEYQGKYYTTLTGTYTLAAGCFSVTIDSGEEPYTTDYHYEVDGRLLTLTDSKGTYTYLRG